MPTFRVITPPTVRNQLAQTARGLISETYPLAGAVGTGIPTTGAANGTLSLTLLGLRAGDTVTNLVANVTTQGTSLTFAKLGLFDSGGNFLAATASVSATFNSGTGFKVVALTSPYVVLADGGYYVGYLQWGSGATGATLLRGSATSGVQLGTSARSHALVATQTDISANVTLADASTAFWFGVS